MVVKANKDAGKVVPCQKLFNSFSLKRTEIEPDDALQGDSGKVNYFARLIHPYWGIL